MRPTLYDWVPCPVNQSPEFSKWNFSIRSLRIGVIKPYNRNDRLTDQEPILLAFSDDDGHLQSREGALVLIEKLLAFYNSVTDDLIADFNDEIQGLRGAETGLRAVLSADIYENILKMRSSESIENIK